MRTWLCGLLFCGALVAQESEEEGLFQAKDRQIQQEQRTGNLDPSRWIPQFSYDPGEGSRYLISRQPKDQNPVSWQQQGLRAELAWAFPEACAAWEKALELDPTSQAARGHLAFLLAPVSCSRSASMAATLDAKGIEHFTMIFHLNLWNGPMRWDGVKWAKGLAATIEAIPTKHLETWNARFLVDAVDVLSDRIAFGGDFTVPVILDRETPVPKHGNIDPLLKQRQEVYPMLLRAMLRIPACSEAALRRLICIDSQIKDLQNLVLHALAQKAPVGSAPQFLPWNRCRQSLVPIDLPLLEEYLADQTSLPKLDPSIERRVRALQALHQGDASAFAKAATEVLQTFPQQDGMTAVMRQWWKRKLTLDPMPLMKDQISKHPPKDILWFRWLCQRAPDSKSRGILLEQALANIPQEKQKIFLETIASEPTLVFHAVGRLGTIPTRAMDHGYGSDRVAVMERCVPRKGLPDYVALDDLIRSSPWIGPRNKLRLILLYELSRNINSIDWDRRQAIRKHLLEVFPDQPLITVLHAMTAMSIDERANGVLKHLGPVAADLVTGPGGAKEFKEFCEWVLPVGQRLSIDMDATAKAVGEAVKDTDKARLQQTGSEFGLFIEDQMAMLLLANVDRFEACWQQVWKIQMDLNAGKENLDSRCLMPPNGYSFGPHRWIEKVASIVLDRDDPVARQKMVAILRDDPTESICLSDRFDLFSGSTVPSVGNTLARLQEEYRTEVPLMPNGDVSAWIPWWLWTVQDLNRKDLDAFAVWLELQPATPLRTSVLLLVRLQSALKGGDKATCQSLAKESIALLPPQCSAGWRLNLLSILLDYENALGCQFVPDSLAVQAASDFGAISARRPRRLCDRLRLTLTRRLVQIPPEKCREQASNLYWVPGLPKEIDLLLDPITTQIQISGMVEIPLNRIGVVARLLELAIHCKDEKQIAALITLENEAVLRLSGTWAMLLRLGREDLLLCALASKGTIIYEPLDEIWTADRWNKDVANASKMSEDQRLLVQMAVETLPSKPRRSGLRGHEVVAPYQDIIRRSDAVIALAEKQIWKDPLLIAKLQQMCSRFFTPTTDRLSRLGIKNGQAVNLNDPRQVVAALADGDPLPFKTAVKNRNLIQDSDLLQLVRLKLAAPSADAVAWTSASLAHLRECVPVLVAWHEKNRMFDPFGFGAEWALCAYLAEGKLGEFETLANRIVLLPGTRESTFDAALTLQLLVRFAPTRAKGGKREDAIMALATSSLLKRMQTNKLPDLMRNPGETRALFESLASALQSQASTSKDIVGLKALAQAWTRLGLTEKANACMQEAKRLEKP